MASEPPSPTDTAADAPKRQRGIQSIEIGGRLLLALMAANREVGLGDLARAAGMPAAKAHKYLVSLTRIGLCKRNPATGDYDLGSLALRLGVSALQRLDSLREATEEAELMARAIGQTIFITVAGNLGPTVVRIVESGDPLHVNIRIGTVMSMIGTATGRVFAAYLPDSTVRQMLEQEKGRMGGATEPNATLMDDFRRDLLDVRRHGLARAVRTPIPDVSAISVPVFDATGDLALVLTAMGPAGYLDTDWNGPIAQAMTAGAGRVSRRLGWTGPVDRAGDESMTRPGLE